MKGILENSSYSNDGHENEEKKGTISFQTLCSRLTESSSLKSNTKNLLSIPNCFMSLMHLSTMIGLDLSRIRIEGLMEDNNHNHKKKKKRKHRKNREKKKRNKLFRVDMNDKHQLGDFIVFTKC